MIDLYALSVDSAKFETFCGGNLQSEHEACAVVAALPGAADAFVVRDSKAEGAGKEVRFTGAEMDDLARGWVKMRGLAM